MGFIGRTADRPTKPPQAVFGRMPRYQYNARFAHTNFFRNRTHGLCLAFTLLDDITSVLDDVALMTKMAAKKTAGVVGDDLALNANQVTGVSADRELPIIWAVAKGSLVNKIILVPLALLLRSSCPPRLRRC